MKNPTIKHKVCSHDGRLWVIESVKWKTSYTALDLRLVDGDDVCFAEMTRDEYLALNSSLEEQEFSITPSSLVAALAAKPTPPPKPEEHGRWAGGQKAPPVRKPWETRRK